jgi:spermidine synthase
MKPERVIDSTPTPDGNELLLYERDGVFTLRIGGIELMTSRAHDSEEELAAMAMKLVSGKRSPRVLVGGLGMGYTTRAVLDSTPRPGEVVVAELLPAVVRWNRDHIGHLAGSPMNDPRVTIIEKDLFEVIAGNPGAFDVILNDVDNGPGGCILDRNERLYRPDGLAAIRRCLRPRGVLAVWSVDDDPRFVKALGKAGFDARAETVFARNIPKGHRHTVFVARAP